MWRECRKTTTDEPGSTCVHCTCWWEFEGKDRLFAGVWDTPGMLRMQHCESPKPFWIVIGSVLQKEVLSIYSTTMLPPTMIQSTCRISSMYSSSAEATYEPACIQREKLHTVKMEIPTGPSPSSGTSWGMGETHTEGELQNHLHNSSGTPACNILKRAWSML